MFCDGKRKPMNTGHPTFWAKQHPVLLHGSIKCHLALSNVIWSLSCIAYAWQAPGAALTLGATGAAGQTARHNG